MGQNPSTIKQRLRDRPIVAIVGGGFAGSALAKKLDAEFNVLLFDRKNYFFNNIGALRSSVRPNQSKNIIIPYDNLLKYGAVIHAEVKKINEKNIIVSNLNEPIPFDYLVIATGSSYAFPAKVPVADASDITKTYDEIVETIKQSNKILIVGGGPVGIELLGEICDYYPEKKVTLVQSNEKIIPGVVNDELRVSLLTRIKETFPNAVVRTGEKVLLDDEMKQAEKVRYIKGNKTVTTSKNESIEADLILFCGGAYINSKSYEESFSKLLDEEKRLKVRPTLQLEGYDNIFAIGDCCNIAPKMAFMAKIEVDVVAGNVSKLYAKQTNLANFQPLRAGAMLVPLGTRQGATQLPMGNGKLFGAKVTQAIKGDLLVSQQWKALGYRDVPQQLKLPNNTKTEEEAKEDNSNKPNSEANLTNDNFTRIYEALRRNSAITENDVQKLFDGLKIEEHENQIHT